MEQALPLPGPVLHPLCVQVPETHARVETVTETPTLTAILDRLPNVEVDRQIADVLLRNKEFVPEALMPRRPHANKIKPPRCIFFVPHTSSHKRKQLESLDDEDEWNVMMQEVVRRRGSNSRGAPSAFDGLRSPLRSTAF